MSVGLDSTTTNRPLLYPPIKGLLYKVGQLINNYYLKSSEP
jgi:hypothetical protein